MLVNRITQLWQPAYALMERCELCPRRCGVNCLADQKGFCRVPRNAKAYSYSAKEEKKEVKRIIDSAVNK